MSEGLPTPDKEELKDDPEQNTSGAKGGENMPCCSGGGIRPEKEGKSGKHNESESNWRKWGEIIFKFFELAAFIAIILTFLEMRKTRIDDERAWISIKSVGHKLPYSAEHIGIHVEITNIGKTPASIENEDISVEAVYENSTNIIYERTGPAIIIPPDGVFISDIDETNAIGENDFALLTEKKLKHYFLMKIRYRDVFNEVRHTDAGYIISGEVNGTIPPIPSFWRMD